MDTAGLRLSFKQLGLMLFLLLSLKLQLHLALPRNSIVSGEPKVPKTLSHSIRVGGKNDINEVRRRGGGAVGARGGGGGEHGNGGTAAGDNGGGTKSPDGQGGAVIPVYAAGAKNHNPDHKHHGSGSGTINCIGLSCLVLTLFTSFFFV
ncbi:hypothetical protein REPUB_Repub05bG0147000 [Reevesia pubescens]